MKFRLTQKEWTIRKGNRNTMLVFIPLKMDLFFLKLRKNKIPDIPTKGTIKNDRM